MNAEVLGLVGGVLALLGVCRGLKGDRSMYQRPPAGCLAHAREESRWTVSYRGFAFALWLALTVVTTTVAAQWSRYCGRISEKHTVDEYQFRITSDRDPRFADYGETGEDVRVSVRKKGRVITSDIFIGSLVDDTPAPSFSIARVPSETLVIVTRNDRFGWVVFALDTATGECWPPRRRDYELYVAREKQWLARVRSAQNDARYFFSGFLGS